MITTDRSNAKEVNGRALDANTVNNGENWTYTPGEIVIRDDGKSTIRQGQSRDSTKIGKSAGQ